MMHPLDHPEVQMSRGGGLSSSAGLDCRVGLGLLFVIVILGCRLFVVLAVLVLDRVEDIYLDPSWPHP